MLNKTTAMYESFPFTTNKTRSFAEKCKNTIEMNLHMKVRHKQVSSNERRQNIILNI